MRVIQVIDPNGVLCLSQCLWKTTRKSEETVKINGEVRPMFLLQNQNVEINYYLILI